MLFRIFFSIFLIFLNKCESSEISPYVVGGSKTQPGEFPFIVSLQYITTNEERPWLHYCAGTILTSSWILTSASCVFGDEDPTQNRVQYGVNEISYLSDAANVVGMEQLFWYDGYDDAFKFNDIGLIKVVTPIEFDHFDYKVKLPTSSEYFASGTSAWFAGFGRNASDAPMGTNLQKVNYQIYNRQDCATQHGESHINHNNICGGQSGSSNGQCTGGPLLVDGVQIGIASWSQKPCEESTLPGVFTAIGPFINWIKATTGEHLRLRMFMTV